MRATYTKARSWYEEHERRVGSFFLLTGFVVDSLTLRRIDLLRENLWVITNILLAATCIVIINKLENDRVETQGEAKQHFWLTNIMQFAFGAQLGTFIIFYFRSGALSASWPFLGLLLCAVLANEVFKKHHSRLVFHSSFLFLSIFTFSIFIVPVLIHKLGALIFLFSGLLSLIIFWFFLSVLRTVSRERFSRSRRALVTSVAAIYIGINILYFTNLIPPIPLSLKDGGIYHSVTRSTSGGYTVLDESRNLLSHLDPFINVHVAPGGELYAFSAVFSPSDLNTTVVHVWERFDKDKVRWVQEGRVNLSVLGGADTGWRTFSVHSGFAPGAWRVSVETPRGQVIGRMRFEVVPVSARPTLVEKSHQ